VVQREVTAKMPISIVVVVECLLTLVLLLLQ
jgi:hypothetical protein